MSISLKLLKKVRCRIMDRTTGQPLAGIILSLSVAIGDGKKSALPVSTLSSDRTGYVSFDLQPLIKRGLDTVSAVLVSAPQVNIQNHNLLETLLDASTNYQAKAEQLVIDSQTPDSVQYMRNQLEKMADQIKDLQRQQQFGPRYQEQQSLCIEFPIYADKSKTDLEISSTACQVLDIASIQSPDIYDYQLSPYSFVMPAQIRFGDDCCETLGLSTLPVQEHRFYRVVLRNNPADSAEPAIGVITRPVEVTGNLVASEPMIKFADVLEYRQRWYALGHSLGEIKYSLPLAPGESTQLAVIEWSREDSASRFDRVRGTEFLSHELHRDRSIDESVDAGLKESQGGWSWLGGLSSGMAYDAQQYGQYTGNWAAGGSTSNSWGNRDLEADSQQDLHDSITQGTSYVRSLTSTVIVQASQAEHNVVQTRRVANHNHCHALTIQYYEVLRHFRLQTEFIRKRKAILIPFSPFAFTSEVALRFRTLLEWMLLDQTLLPCFDALVRLNLVSGIYDTKNGSEANGKTPPAEKKTPKTKRVDVVGTLGEGVGSGINVAKDDSFTFNAKGEITFSRTAPAWSKGPNGDPDTADTSFLAPGLRRYSLVYKIGQNGPWQQGGSYTSAVANTSDEIIFGVNDTLRGFEDNYGWGNDKWEVDVDYLETETESKPKDPSVEEPDPSFRKVDDQLCAAKLLSHLAANQGYYNRIVWMLMDPTERRLFLEAALGNSELLFAMDDRPLAVSGNYLAFAYNVPIPDWGAVTEVDLESLESIVTLPTRGLFAEAQLSHCNSCEKRDITRMWDWTVMTAEEPPAISGIEPGPQGQIPNLTPSQLPSNVIQITQPAQAPDPTGLANALTLLGTPNIFRDMSGLDEASKLVGKLADGTIKTLEEMVKTARLAKEKLDAEKAKAGNNGTSQKQTPTERYDNLQVAKEVAGSADELGLNEQQKSNLSQDILGDGNSGILDQFLKTILSASPSTSTSASGSAPAPALAQVAAFRSAAGTSPWKLNRAAVADRLTELIHKPELIDQDGLNLCGPASFFHLWIKRDPLAFARFATQLYETGSSYISTLAVKPGSDLLKQDYATIASRVAGFSPPADWMVMSALRDSENSVFDYEGTPEEDVSAITLPGTLAEWLRTTGLYTTVNDETNLYFTKGMAHATGLVPAADRDIVMLVNSDMLSGFTPVPVILNLFPNHFIVLNSPLVITSSGEVKIDYWSGGSNHTETIARASFEDNYYGAVIAER